MNTASFSKQENVPASETLADLSEDTSGVTSINQPTQQPVHQMSVISQSSFPIQGTEGKKRDNDSLDDISFDEEEIEILKDESAKSQGSNISNLSIDYSDYEEDEVEIKDQAEENEEENVKLQFEDEDQEFFDEQIIKKESKPKNEVMKINLRNFQATLFQNSLDRNSIIYLPTGTGKTRIAICSMYYYLCKYGTSKKIVFLANTIQLVKQQAEAIKQTLAAIIQNENFARDLRQKLGQMYIQLNWTEKDINNQVVCVHGQRSQDPTVTKRKRIEAYLTTKKEFINQMKKSTVNVMISQMFLNCLRRGYIKLTDYSFIVFDECHHCGGDHPYSGVMKEFYFDQKKKMREDEKMNKLKDDERLPIVMGLTASPVSQPYSNYKQLTKQLKNLCVNLDSNFSYYPFGDQITNQTQILIEKISEPEDSNKEHFPLLLDFFERFKDHKVSLDKIRIHFPEYYECVKKVIDMMSSQHQCLRVEVDGSQIVDPELYLLYDIKQCLLMKLRDLWLELGQFAFTLGFHEMNVELSRLTGLRNQQNTKLLEQVKNLLKTYDQEFRLKYGHCKKQFMSTKLIKLIDILKPQSEEEKNQDKVGDMVLVFAFKRRTVKYLQLVLQKYKDLLPQNEKKFYKSVGVTGYAGRTAIRKIEDGKSYQSNPSAEEDESAISKYYSVFMEREREQMRNRIHIQSSMVTDNAVLNNEMNRMFISKMGKMLLEVEQKYHNQLKKLIEFKRKEHRVLITTSVTQEGFDIPGCNLVISFDTPFSMKSYIQIKGRARKRNSKYIIFTFEKYYNKMTDNKKIYDNTINAIYHLAINELSKEDIDGLEKVKNNVSYEKVKTKGGALINTNYALELLKSYFTTLKPPNKPYFHYVQTSNICYKCVIKFPQSSTCSRSYVMGKPQPRKQQAQKSAAFIAVKILKKEGFIRDDLRPSRLEQLQDELELQKYDDIGLYSKDSSYRQILDRYVLIDEANDKQTQKKLIRFYYKSIEPERLQFHNLNRHFDYKQFEKNEFFSFQIYLVKFSNKINTDLLNEDDSIHEIGILTCFEKEETEQIFAGFRQHLQHSCQQQFELKLVNKQLLLNKEEYETLKRVHNFLLTSEKNNEADYFNYLNNEPPILYPLWSHVKSNKKKKVSIDEQKRYFPLMVLLKRHKQNKQVKYMIDKQVIKRIQDHIELLKRIYLFHNKPARHIYEKPFEDNLNNLYRLLYETVENQDYRKRKYLVQCIDNNMCFHKGLLTTDVVNYNKQIQQIEQNRKKNKLKNKYEKMKKQFYHFREENNIFNEQVVKFQIWKNMAKEDLNQILNKQLKIKKVQDEKGLYRFLRQFILYPVTYPTMLKISLISKYVFQVFEDFSVALYFRKFYLSEIFKNLKNKVNKQYQFSYYKSIILDYSEKLFPHMQNAGKSRHLRDLGKLFAGNTYTLTNLKHDISSIDMGQSSIMNQQNSMDEASFLNQSSSKVLSQSIIAKDKMEQPSVHQVHQPQYPKLQINVHVLSNLKIEDILRSLTSKIYKHQKINNYEQFEFIGDVVLKYLATLQIFLEKTTCQEGEMHIARANLICNANLHRATIRKKLFQYIFTTKTRSEPAPLVKTPTQPDKVKERKKFANTDIELLGDDEDDELGYQYIPGKVHADVMEALIGIFYLKNKNLSDCQTLLYAFGVLNHPTLQIHFNRSKETNYSLPAPLVSIENKLKYSFKHKELLVQAMTHPSFLSCIEDVVDEQENSFSRIFNDSKEDQSIHNISLMSDKAFEKECMIKKHQTFYERIEFLGDAFLDLLVVQYLYDQGGDYLDDEGTLSFLKQSAVSNKTLGFIALKENLHEYLMIDVDQIDETMKDFRRISRQIETLPSPLKFSKLKIGSLKILGDIFQSLVGAILIDNDFNYEDTKVVVLTLIEKYIKHFTSLSFVEECPTFKYKEYLDQNNYKKYKLSKVLEEGILNGEYLYRLTDKTGNLIGEPIRASNDKDAWDIFLEVRNE